MPISKIHLGSVLKNTLDNNGTIADAARNLGVSIIELIPYLKQLATQNITIDNLFKTKRWPLDINTGFIYIGGVPLLSPQGERAGLLKPGMHVLAKKLPRKNKAQKYDYYTIYWPAKIIYRKYLKIRIAQDSNGKISKATYIKDARGNTKVEWLSDEADNMPYFRKSVHSGIFLKETTVTKQVFVPDREIGQVNETMIVNITYDWT